MIFFIAHSAFAYLLLYCSPVQSTHTPQINKQKANSNGNNNDNDDSIPTGLSMDKQQRYTLNNIIITAKIRIESSRIVVLYVWFDCLKRGERWTQSERLMRVDPDRSMLVIITIVDIRIVAFAAAAVCCCNQRPLTWSATAGAVVFRCCCCRIDVVNPERGMIDPERTIDPEWTLLLQSASIAVADQTPQLHCSCWCSYCCCWSIHCCCCCCCWCYWSWTMTKIDWSSNQYQLLSDQFFAVSPSKAKRIGVPPLLRIESTTTRLHQHRKQFVHSQAFVWSIIILIIKLVGPIDL